MCSTLDCPDGYQNLISNSKYCYKVVSTRNVDWNTANTACKEDSGDLASFDTKEERNYLSNNFDAYWVGYNWLEGKWKATDASLCKESIVPSSYGYFGTCARTWKSSPNKLKGYYCGYTAWPTANVYGYICQKPKKVSTQTPAGIPFVTMCFSEDGCGGTTGNVWVSIQQGDRFCETDYLSTGPWAGECYYGNCKGTLLGNLENPCLKVYTHSNAYYDQATVSRVDVNILGVKYTASGNWDLDTTTTNDIHQACHK